MKTYIVRCTTIRSIKIKADSEEQAIEEACKIPEYDWDQSDGPEDEAEEVL